MLFLLKCHKLGEMDHEWNICLEADEISFRRELVISLVIEWTKSKALYAQQRLVIADIISVSLSGAFSADIISV